MRVLVTGGTGFLGGAVVRLLLGRGDRVRSFNRSTSAELERLGVEQVAGDLADAGAVRRAVAGCDAAIHTAAKAGIWGPKESYWLPNVVGTQHLIDACRAEGVGRLVFTSSPSVVFDGRDQEGIDESTPYPERFLAHYPASKAEAERRVLAANGPGLLTVALRPHLIWGPGDHQLIPRLLERARSGKLIRVGTQANRVDHIYIDDAARAHLLALDALTGPGCPPAGRAYFLSQGEPVPLWDWIGRILDAAGLPPIRRTISPATAYAAGALMEAAWRAFRLDGEPPFTRFLARQFTTAHWFEIGAARRDLGYLPELTTEEGLRRLGDALRGAPR